MAQQVFRQPSAILDTLMLELGSVGWDGVSGDLRIGDGTIGGIAAASTFASGVSTINGFTGAVSLSLDNLIGVNASAPSVGHVISWDGAQWLSQAQTLSLASVSGHTDVDTVTVFPLVGEFLGWDGSNWVPSPGSGGATEFPALNDTPSSYLGAQLKVLRVNAGSSAVEFVGSTFLDLGSINLLSDVDTVTFAPLGGQVLAWNGARWEPKSISPTIFQFKALQDTPSNYTGDALKMLRVDSLESQVEFVTVADVELGSIDKLSDVDTTTSPPSAGHVLTWSGTEWEPAPATGGGGLGVFDHSFLIADWIASGANLNLTITGATHGIADPNLIYALEDTGFSHIDADVTFDINKLNQNVVITVANVSGAAFDGNVFIG